MVFIIVLINIFSLCFNIVISLLAEFNEFCVSTSRLIIARNMLRGPVTLCILIPCNITILVKLFYDIRSLSNVAPAYQIAKKRNIKITILILSATLSHIVLVAPFSIFFICCQQSFVKFRNFFGICTILNSSLNFFLYSLSSKDVRRLVKSYFQNAFDKCFRRLNPTNRVEPQGQELPEIMVTNPRGRVRRLKSRPDSEPGMRASRDRMQRIEPCLHSEPSMTSSRRRVQKFEPRRDIDPRMIRRIRLAWQDKVEPQDLDPTHVMIITIRLNRGRDDLNDPQPSTSTHM